MSTIDPIADPAADAAVRGDDRSHVFHSWSAQALIDPLPVAGGEGATFWDYAGNRYLDFSSQLVNLNLGHQHPDLVRAIQDQASPFVYVVRVPEGATLDETMNAVIGGLDPATGQLAGIAALQETRSEMKSRILIAPGFSQHKAVADALIAVAQKTRAGESYCPVSFSTLLRTLPRQNG